VSAHTSLLRQMPCGLSSVWRVLRVLRKARVCERVRQGNAVYLALCALPHFSIFVRQSHMKASTFVPLQSICVVKYVDYLNGIEDIK
jgi:hypothetical protein